MTRQRPWNHELMQRRLREMETLLDYLEAVAPVTADALRADLGARLAVERALTQLVEFAVNINTHVVVAGGRLPPDDYRASFSEAAEEGLLSGDLATRLAPSAGLRNILVHRYLEVDLATVSAAVEEARHSFREYVRQVARHLQRRQPGNRTSSPGFG